MAKNKKEEVKEEVQEEVTAQESEKVESSEEKQKIEELEVQIQELKDSKLRIAAEYDNFRKRSAREKESLYGEASMATTAKFLPVLDNLERAVKQETTDEAYKKGVEMTLTQMYAILEKLDVKEIPALGEQFDPALHNAVLHIEDESIDENTIVEVFEKGFMMGERVIRHATVKVAN